MDALLEFDLAHSYCDEMERRIVLAHGNPRHLVHPHQHLPAEEEPVVIHVTRHHQFVRCHGRFLRRFQLSVVHEPGSVSLGIAPPATIQKQRLATRLEVLHLLLAVPEVHMVMAIGFVYLS